MVSLGQKFKKPKTCEKLSHKMIRIVHCKKPLEKTPNIGEMRWCWKSTILQRLWSVWVKNLKCQKHAKNHSTKNIRVVLREKSAPKEHQILEKKDNFETRPSWKGYRPCKRYSLCKMVSLNKKLRMQKTCEKPFYKIIRVVLWRKPLEKTAKIEEMRRSWKSATLQRL